ncbi:type II toxin-antitoxin system HicA family toxin [Ornithobacterium rhinotracheale]
MKYSEFHRKIKKNGWQLLRISGSHYIYEKNGKTYPVPFHGSKEMNEGLRKKIVREMGLQ